MRIEYIKLYNYRLYKGLNQIVFPKDEKKHIYVIYGENGFGKTTLLQSLMWCLYGRMIIDVDDLSRADINLKGYESYLRDNLNTEVSSEKSDEGKNFYVEILISELQIPTMPSANLRIKRSYDLAKNKEAFELFIDGHENELARQIGYDVFVNDFVLSKDIARLFFFDSERVVKLAEGQSKEERFRLGSAYNRVIGIKKYEELKKNLESISLKMKRDALDEAGEEKWMQLSSELKEVEGELDQIDGNIAEASSKKESLTNDLGIIQNQLLREGSMVDIEERSRAIEERETCMQRNQDFKNQLKDYLDYAPFAIAGGLFQDAIRLVEHDFKILETKNSFIRQNETVNDIKQKLEDLVSKVDISDDRKNYLLRQMEAILIEYQVETVDDPVSLDIDKDTHDKISGVSEMLYTTFQSEFKIILDDYKRNKQRIDQLNKLLHRAAEEDGNERIAALKKHLSEIQQKITEQESLLIELGVTKATKTLEKEKIQKQCDFYHASMKVRESNKEKSDLTNALICEISDYLHQLRTLRNKSIEKHIKRILNMLMHKSDFVDRVQLETKESDFDVRLFSSGNEIQKSALSKGEQQLYASALLMALVEESGILFPVFIDSPLQKFDKKHAERIITDFYPKVSTQVVLLPIIEKELTAEEENLMQPMVKAKYCIINDGNHSKIEEVCLSR